MKELFVSLFILLGYNTFCQQIEAEKFVDSLMQKMTLDEKIGQLNLVTPGWGMPTGAVVSNDVETKIKAGKVGGIFGAHNPEIVKRIQDYAVLESRMKIPLLFGSDVIHGYQTIFPIPLGLACSWDMNLIKQSAQIAAKEAASNGICWTFSPMVDICRDPRWGRIAEGAGEDALLGSDIARAMVEGYQGNNFNDNEHILSCVKHFALYGAAEAGRDYNTTDMSKIRMYQDYFPPYKAAIDAGVKSVMTSFNEIDGIPATANKWLLHDVLRKQWNFQGFVVSDYTAVNEMIDHGLGDLKQVSALALHAGLDMDMVGEGYLTTLTQSLADGKVSIEQINFACKNILIAKYDIGLFHDPYKFINAKKAEQTLLCDKHRKFARKAAAASMVLLKNEKNILPLPKDKKIALIGPLADSRENMLGTWAVSGDFKKAITVLEGFKNAKLNFKYAKGSNIADDTTFIKNVNAVGEKIIKDKRNSNQLMKEAINVAKTSDAVVLILGEASEMSGESSSRTDIQIPEVQKALLRNLKHLGKPIILVVMAGRPLILNEENNVADAILYMWHAGTESGNALVDILLGNEIPSAKLVNSFPRSVGQIPIYYNHKNTGRPLVGNTFQKFRSNYLDESNSPLYPFGYGLSYTSFNYSNLKINTPSITKDEKLIAQVTVNNIGMYDALEVVQCYLKDEVGSVTRPVKELKKYQKVFIKKGESRLVNFEISEEDLRFYNADLKYISEPGKFTLSIGPNAAEGLSVGFELR